MSAQRTITLVEEDDGWRAIDEDTGVECRGEERELVLERLDDAVAVNFDGLDAGDGPDEPTADDENTGDENAGDAALEWFEE